MGCTDPRRLQSFALSVRAANVTLQFRPRGLSSFQPLHRYCSLKTKLTNPRTLLAVLFLAFVTLFVSVQHKKRIIVTFDYDFGLHPACSLTVTKNCIKQFNVYEIAADGRIKLFSLPVPGGAAGIVKGITGTSPRIALAGEHIVAVTAESAEGFESDPGACTTRIQVKRQINNPDGFQTVRGHSPRSAG